MIRYKKEFVILVILILFLVIIMYILLCNENEVDYSLIV